MYQMPQWPRSFVNCIHYSCISSDVREFMVSIEFGSDPERV